MQKVTKITAYYRVSTDSQGKSGLGLADQRKQVADYAARFNGASIIGEFTEIESGRAQDRPKLREAIAKAKATRSTLVIAKLDRMGRHAAEVLTLLDRRDIKIVFAESPEASALENGIRAIVAEEEARVISARTKAALAAAKRNGVKLGNPNGAAPLARYRALHGNIAATDGARRNAYAFAAEMRPYIAAYLTEGLSDARIAARMNEEGIATCRAAKLDDEDPRRAALRWHETSVRNLRARLAI